MKTKEAEVTREIRAIRDQMARPRRTGRHLCVLRFIGGTRREVDGAAPFAPATRRCLTAARPESTDAML